MRCVCVFLMFLFVSSQRTGLVQFATEPGRNAALQMNKTEFHGESIGVAPSRFSLITVAQAPTEVPSSSVSESLVATKSADNKVATKEAEVKKSVAASEEMQDEVHSETAPPVKSAPLPK